MTNVEQGSTSALYPLYLGFTGDWSSKQELFDFILAGLRKQGAPAANIVGTDGCSDQFKIRCLYKTSTGLRCAIGLLFSDEINPEDPSIFKGGVLSLSKFLFPPNITPRNFLSFVQTEMHDIPAHTSIQDSVDFMSLVEKGAADIAARFGLRYSPPQQGDSRDDQEAS